MQHERINHATQSRTLSQSKKAVQFIKDNKPAYPHATQT